jgi:hypothetical protein
MHDIGTGGAPCAATLANRFTQPCGGRDHGDTAGLDQGQLADLTAFLESL